MATPAIERLAEDESLRGDLTDDGFLPLQSWAFARLTGIAEEAARRTAPERAMQDGADAVRGLLVAAVAAAQTGRTAELVAEVCSPAVPPTAVPRARVALRRLAIVPDADANAAAIAAALSAATGLAPAGDAAAATGTAS